MADIFDKWNKAVDLTGLKKDIEEAQKGGNTYVDVPIGTYEVRLEKAELKASKNGDPMVSIWFKILEGDYKGQRIFMNQIITKGFQIHIVDNFLKSMETGLDIRFEDYKQYADLLLDVAEACDKNLDFALEYGENKGFKTFKIVSVFDYME